MMEMTELLLIGKLSRDLTHALSRPTSPKAAVRVTLYQKCDCRSVSSLQPVQGFDYAKQHLGQQGADEEVIPVTQETVVLPLPVRDAPASQERDVAQDGSTIKTAKSTETRKR